VWKYQVYWMMQLLFNIIIVYLIHEWLLRIKERSWLKTNNRAKFILFQLINLNERQIQQYFLSFDGTRLDTFDDPSESLPREIVLKANRSSASLLLSLHPIDVADANDVSVVASFVTRFRSGVVSVVASFVTRARSGVTDGPLWMIVFRCEVNVGSDFTEVDFVDVFHLKMRFFGDEGKDLVRVKYSNSVMRQGFCWRTFLTC
jgi:hypothetical protein